MSSVLPYTVAYIDKSGIKILFVVHFCFIQYASKVLITAGRTLRLHFSSSNKKVSVFFFFFFFFCASPSFDSCVPYRLWQYIFSAVDNSTVE